MISITENTLDHIEIKTRIGNIHLTTIIFITMLVIFIGVTAFFAMKLQQGIVPDEIAHFINSKNFATTWLIPDDVPEASVYGSIAHKPNLYYWINGRALNVLDLVIDSPSEGKKLVMIRMLSVVYSALAVVFCFLTAKEVIKGRWWPLLVVFLLTNTLMFVFLSGGANYDNLANLFNFAAIYFLVRVLKDKEFYQNSLLFLICLSAGTLTKITSLPLAAITAIIWCLYVLKNRARITFKPHLNWKFICLLFVFGALIGLNFSIYGINLVKFRSLLPACDQVLSKEQCLTNPIVQRDTTEILPQKLSLQDILQGSAIDPIRWFLDFWLPTMIRKGLGIMGHLLYTPPALILTLYRLFLFLVVVVAIRHWKRPSYLLGSLLAIFFFYLFVLLQTNYESELISGFQHFAVQGRYIFPVIGIMYILAVYVFAQIKHRFIAQAIVLFTLLLFLRGGPLYTLLALDFIKYPSPEIQPAEPIGEIVGGVEISQDFIAKCKGTVEQIELQFATYRRENDFPVTIRIIDLDTNQVAAQQTITGESILDNTWRGFAIPPFAGVKATPYRIIITSDHSFPGNAVTIWTSSKDEYPYGEAMVNGRPTGKDLLFRYRCRQPALAEWFN